MARALALHARGHRFDSGILHNNFGVTCTKARRVRFATRLWWVRFPLAPQKIRDYSRIFYIPLLRFVKCSVISAIVEMADFSASSLLISLLFLSIPVTNESISKCKSDIFK